MKNSFRENEPILFAFLLSLFSFWLLIITISILVIGCIDKSTTPMPDFIGKWADDSHPPALFTVEFRADHSVTFTVRNSGEITSQSDGVWSYHAPLLITIDSKCQEGIPLHLVECTAPPDTVHPSISGDSWPLSFERNGEITSFDLRRVN